MQATMVDLRYHTKDLMRAIDRNETVEIYYRGKLKARMSPPGAPVGAKNKPRLSAKDHPLFGFCKDDKEPVQDKVKRLRKDRFDL